MTLDELQRLLDAATPGPMTIWTGLRGADECFDVCGPKQLPTSAPYKPYTSWDVFAQCGSEADAVLIAAMHAALPDLLRIARAATKHELFNDYDNSTGNVWVGCCVCHATYDYSKDYLPPEEDVGDDAEDRRVALAKSKIRHDPDCAWVLVRKMAGGGK